MQALTRCVAVLALMAGSAFPAAAQTAAAQEGVGDSAGVAAACSAEADRLGLHGPERFDFRAKCKNRGPTFSQAHLNGACRMVIVETGIAGRASEQLRALPDTTTTAQRCHLAALMHAAQNKAVSLLDGDARHCGYPRADLDRLRAGLEHWTYPSCNGTPLDPGL